MQGQRLRKGMHVKFAGQEYRIEQRLPNDELQLKHLATEMLTSKWESELIQAIFANEAELLGSSHEVSYLQMRQAKSLVSDFSALEDNDPRKFEAKRRLKYINEIRKQGLTAFGKNAEKLQPIIDKVKETIDDRNPPSRWSLRRWDKDYKASGEDVRVLVPAYKARGSASEHDGRRISGDLAKCRVVEKIIDEVVREEYLSLTRPTAQSAYDTIVARIAQENEFRNGNDKLPTPHRNTIYRFIDKMDPYEKDKARLGKRIADLRHKVNRQGVRPSRPLERVEIDDTKLDLFVIDETTGLPIGRPWLMLAICAFTKMILGYYLSFVRPSYLSVMQCLLHSIRPKTYVRERYPEIKHSWEAYGIPELVVVDNAKQYYSASFDESCLQIGTLTQYAPVKHPFYKPSVERTFGGLNTRLLHQMPGTTFSNISQKWDYDPKKNALISMDRLERIVHNWIVDVYQHSFHRGIDDVPARRWEIGTKNFPPALPPSAGELNVLLGHVDHRVISNSGVELFGGLYYNDPGLTALRAGAKKGDRFKVKYDPMDISLIHVYDSKNNRYLPAPAVDQDYTKGLTLWQHKVIKREARAKAEEYVDIVELCLAKERIKKIVAEGFNSTSKSDTNVRAALWLGIGENHNGSVEANSQATGGRQAQPESDGSSRPVRFNPGTAASAGVSNFDSAVDTGDSADSSESAGQAKSSIEIAEAETPSKKASKRRRRQGRNQSPDLKPEPPQDDANLDEDRDHVSEELSDTAEVEDEEELDLTGWESGYDLPQ